jgi:hypothetical protein
MEDKMAEIRIDAAKAERMISQILREQRGLLPADANALASIICQRLTAATPTRLTNEWTHDEIRHYRADETRCEIASRI